MHFVNLTAMVRMPSHVPVLTIPCRTNTTPIAATTFRRCRSRRRTGRNTRRGCVGAVTCLLWIGDTALGCWQTCGPGGQPRYSDAAVLTNLMLRTAFKLPLRQTGGLLASVLTLMKLTISARDHTTVSRCAVKLPLIQPAQVPHGALHVLIDSTGLQV